MKYIDELAEEMGYTICPLSTYTYTHCDEDCEHCKEYIEFKQFYKKEEKQKTKYTNGKIY